MKNIPVVAIVGRSNVGKSSLFNRLVSKRQAIVAQEPGTTRDAVYGRVETPKGIFLIVDTAGLKNPDDQFEQTIQAQITDAATSADCIVVVVDALGILTNEDRQVAKLAHKSLKPVLLAINKADQGKKIDLNDFNRLGIKNPILTSATQNQGIDDLVTAILENISPIRLKTTKSTSVALIGRPNVGKSSLFNALADKQQAIVADRAGTTRDVNSISINYHTKPYELFDTAGIRRPGKVARGVEHFSVIRAVSAIDQSDVCVLVIDANEPGVALDQKLAGMIKESGKSLIIAMTKWDSLEKDAFTHDQMTSKLRLEFQHVPWAPFIAVSSITGQNVAKLMELIAEITERRITTIKTNELNRWLGQRVNHHPPAGLKNKHPKLRYITQTDTEPPEFTIFGTYIRFLHWSYKRYLERELRESYDFIGTPIKLVFRVKDN